MPITRERRYFVEDGIVIGHHPYWPSAAFADCSDLPSDWEAKLAALNQEDPAEVAELSALSAKVGVVLPGAWSVDWLHTARGWYLTDMAHAETSFVWPQHPGAPDRPWAKPSAEFELE